MLAKYLWEMGSIIITFLGGLHVYYTFFTNAFSARNKKIVEEMKSSSPILSQEINMWKAWIGFNGSHSSGIIFIGVINFYVAFRYFAVLTYDRFFSLFTILTISFYVWLAKKYWFNPPFIGVSLALTCFIVSYILTMISK